jgi:hypothetical protein
MNWIAVWYLALALLLVLGIGIQIAPKIVIDSGEEHFIGANVTKIGNRCVCTFLGGWDYDSFFGDIRIDNVSVGHVNPRTVLYDGECKNITIEGYEKSVQTYVVIFRYSE